SLRTSGRGRGARNARAGGVHGAGMDRRHPRQPVDGARTRLHQYAQLRPGHGAPLRPLHRPLGEVPRADEARDSDPRSLGAAFRLRTLADTWRGLRASLFGPAWDTKPRSSYSSTAFGNRAKAAIATMSSTRS